MSQEDEINRREQQAREAQIEPSQSPGPGHPAGETLPEESEPGQLEDTPTIGGEDDDWG